MSQTSRRLGAKVAILFAAAIGAAIATYGVLGAGDRSTGELAGHASSHDCFRINGIVLYDFPNRDAVTAIGTLGPEFFGFEDVDDDPALIAWLLAMNPPDVFGRDLRKYYGSTRFEFLRDLDFSAGHLDMIGYTPLEMPPPQVMVERIAQLKAKYQPLGVQVLIAPQTNLLAQIDALFRDAAPAGQGPDIVGVEVFTRDFDAFLDARWDEILAKHCTSKGGGWICLTIDPDVDRTQLGRVLVKANHLGLKAAIASDFDAELFDYFLTHRCRRRTTTQQ